MSLSTSPRYPNISITDVENYLSTHHKVSVPVEEFYTHDPNWLWTKKLTPREKKIYEYIYVIELNEEISIELYTGISRITKLSRPIGEDAMRLVVVDRKTAQPKLGGKRPIKRTPAWRVSLENGLLKILYELGYKIMCEICGKKRVLRFSKKTNKYFLGCSNYPKCQKTQSV